MSTADTEVTFEATLTMIVTDPDGTVRLIEVPAVIEEPEDG